MKKKAILPLFLIAVFLFGSTVYANDNYTPQRNIILTEQYTYSDIVVSYNVELFGSASTLVYEEITYYDLYLESANNKDSYEAPGIQVDSINRCPNDNTQMRYVLHHHYRGVYADGRVEEYDQYAWFCPTCGLYILAERVYY